MVAVGVKNVTNACSNMHCNNSPMLEPPGGIEPPTYSLRVNRSTD